MTNFSRIAEAADAETCVLNSIDQFIHECCFVDTTSPEIRTPAGILHRTYAAFCEQNQLMIASRVTFMVYLRDSGIETIRTGQGAASLAYKGIRLRTEIQAAQKCSLPTHHIYDNKKAHCPGSCREQRNKEAISFTYEDSNGKPIGKLTKFTAYEFKDLTGTESGINKNTQVLEATKDVGRALVNWAAALREYVVWYVST